MPDTGFKYTSANPTINGAGTAWVNPNNAKGAPDGSTASVHVTGTGASTKMRFTSFSFGVPPDAAAVIGFVVRIRARGGFSV
ncbi:MAG: hypothetical protein ACREJD_09435 [Phycisphaerales bacterium]